ncbi:MAG TPA: serine/threonine-protein kinase, partial [Pyrinomonadaceae bacterium]|nr:serine/threonine-protein kinase [Pyrinomonadaceae bacterium]
MIETGTVLQQRYKIDKQIGQGGMGAVYVATDQRFGSTVAIKETLCMDDNFRKAIEREARLLNSLKHSALPKVTDHFEENGIMFLVMEYIPGEDLCCVLDERGKPFPVDEMVKWGDQLLDALDFLHNQEVPVIHRDIKPQNLKLTPQGQVILLDFGLAKGNPSDVSHQTAAKSIFGYSRSYASLEQIQGTGTDPRSDLYSLAATLYHLLTGVAPEDALTRAMSVLSQKPDPLAPASSLNPAVPRGIAGVLQKAMDLNASERPASAAEMRQMLRESEDYAYLAEPATFIDRNLDPKVFAQP